jgi:ketosteroid isomerase-like protein
MDEATHLLRALIRRWADAVHAGDLARVMGLRTRIAILRWERR